VPVLSETRREVFVVAQLAAPNFGKVRAEMVFELLNSELLNFSKEL
jgi:hypothetical protein